MAALNRSRGACVERPLDLPLRHTRCGQVEHGAERSSEPCPDLVGGRDHHRVAYRHAQLADGAGAEQHGPARLVDEVRRRPGEHLAVARDPLGRLLHLGHGRQGVSFGVAIEHEHEQLGPGGAVDGGVVDLREDAEPTVRQPLEDIGLPKRPAPIEGTPDDPGDDLGDLVVAPGRWHTPVADVEVEVEVGILDPVGVVEAERHLAEAAPQRFEQMEPALDLRPPGRERVVVGVVLGLGVDREAGDVAELRARLHVQERGVEAGQLLHGPLPPLRTAAPALCHRAGGAARWASGDPDLGRAVPLGRDRPGRRRSPTMSAAGSQRVRRPSRLLLAAEGPRALGELVWLQAARPLLASAPRGDGHPVLVLPGLAADDRSTVPLRRFLRGLGYRVHGWRLGANVPSQDTFGRLRDRLARLHAEDARPMSIVGWSLGGIYAREIARTSPEAVRTVVTLGSPFRPVPGYDSHAAPLARALARPWGMRAGNVVARDDRPLPVPSTSVFSRYRRDRPLAGMCERRERLARDDRSGGEPLRIGPPSCGAARGGRSAGPAARATGDRCRFRRCGAHSSAITPWTLRPHRPSE